MPFLSLALQVCRRVGKTPKSDRARTICEQPGKSQVGLISVESGAAQ